MLIENWSLVMTNPYQAPECQSPSLAGEVHGHPKRPNGQAITTSPIKKIKGNLVETASGSFYELGKMDPEYEKRYPDALARLSAKEKS